MAIQGADVYTWVVHTFCEKTWLGNALRDVPQVLRGIIGEPPISRLWDYDTWLRTTVRGTAFWLLRPASRHGRVAPEAGRIRSTSPEPGARY